MPRSKTKSSSSQSRSQSRTYDRRRRRAKSESSSQSVSQSSFNSESNRSVDDDSSVTNQAEELRRRMNIVRNRRSRLTPEVLTLAEENANFSTVENNGLKYLRQPYEVRRANADRIADMKRKWQGSKIVKIQPPAKETPAHRTLNKLIHEQGICVSMRSSNRPEKCSELITDYNYKGALVYVNLLSPTLIASLSHVIEELPKTSDLDLCGIFSCVCVNTMVLVLRYQVDKSDIGAVPVLHFCKEFKKYVVYIHKRAVQNRKSGVFRSFEPVYTDRIIDIIKRKMYPYDQFYVKTFRDCVEFMRRLKPDFKRKLSNNTVSLYRLLEAINSFVNAYIHPPIAMIVSLPGQDVGNRQTRIYGNIRKADISNVAILKNNENLDLRNITVGE